jgi:voltage-gated potassium channel
VSNGDQPDVAGLPEDRLARFVAPQHRIDPLKSLLQRVAIAIGIVAIIAVLAHVGRDGYSDTDGSPLSWLDCIYYSTVTVTTTGYGDIAPVSPAARAVTAFIVTPLRIIFVVVLVGTTLQLLTERYRKARAERRWRRTVKGHTIIVGYGTMGRTAAASLLAHGRVGVADIIVIDLLTDALAVAGERGLVGVVGDATRRETLQRAHIEVADALIVTCNRDDTAALVTLTARELNTTATIAAAVREEENAHLLEQSGATSVVLSSEAAGRLVGLSTRAPAAVGILQDLLVLDDGFDLDESAVDADQAGKTPAVVAGDGIPVAIIRAGRRVAFDDPGFAAVQAGDVVVSIRSR